MTAGLATPRADVGVVGLGVMGRNLALNIVDHGYRVAVNDRDPVAIERCLKEPAAAGAMFGASTLDELAASLVQPRRVLLLVPAGESTDTALRELSACLRAGDVVVDCGNSHFEDTERRVRAYAADGLHLIGAGVSGGEHGARHGPAIMPGGAPQGWPLVRELLRDVAATADGTPCCEWVGLGGAGHYVKMVHNGIEYGDMQLIAEAYDLMHRGLGLQHERMSEVFREWGRGRLDSFLIDITGDILAMRGTHGAPLLDSILDAAGQKGTGRWTGVSALDHGVPGSLVTEAVYARCLSALVELRAMGARSLFGPDTTIAAQSDPFLEDLEAALYASKIICYSQGFMLLAQASEARAWSLDHAAVATQWRGGCIIRSRFLGEIAAACQAAPGLACLALVDPFRSALNACQPGWRRVVSAAALSGIAIPGLASALAFFDGLRTARGPASLLQAQRDYFGGHAYERVDQPRGRYFHTDWTGDGSSAPASTYHA